MIKKTLFYLFICCGLLAGCAPQPKTPLVVFAAGSLIQPFSDLEKAFEAEHPNIDVQNEFHGSIQVIRHATDLHEAIDIIATADAALIPMLMYATTDPETGQPYANWSVRFASNRLGIAYREDSQYAREINSKNWVDILAKPDVKVGIADPRFDAAGYRALMVYALAGELYQRLSLFFDRFDGVFKYPVTLREEAGANVIHVPEILETKTGTNIVIRGSSVQLIALLESGDLDYAFEYESVIQQHNLRLVRLPPELNLGEESMNARYAKVVVQLDFQRFASVKPVFKGERIGYGITIPTNAPHPEVAAEYLGFLFGPKGQEIMAANSHPLLEPLIADGAEKPPAVLRSLVQIRP